MNGHSSGSPGSVRAKDKHRRLRPSLLILNSGSSAAARDLLVADIAVLSSPEATVEWARGSIGTKNTLTAEDAAIVEAAFRKRMQVLESQATNPEQPAEGPVSVHPAAASATEITGSEDRIVEEAQASTKQHAQTSRYR